MKFYSDKNRIMLVQTIASANTFVSSITGIIKNRIISAFPKEYFKQIYTDTSETYQEHNKNSLYNKELYKIAYPSITVTPQLSIDNPVGGMKNILMSSPNMWIPRDLNRQLPLLLEDVDGKYKIYYTSDYTTLNIRFKIITDSFIQATNISYWLKSRFDDSTFKFISDQRVQVEVPKPFIYSIAKMENLFTADPEIIDGKDSYITNKEDLKKLDTFLAAISRNEAPVLRKTSLNTGRQCYFFEEKENLFTLFTDLDIPEGVTRDNSINSEYEINFRVQVSAWWPNAFIMSINKDQYKFISKLIDVGAATRFMSDNTFYSTSIGSPIALDRKAMINFKDSQNEIHIGQNIVHEVLTYDKATSINHLNLAYFLSDEIMKIHSYMIEQGRDTTKLLNIIARSYSFGIPLLGKIDYTNLSIDFEQPIDSDVILDIFIDRAIYENMLLEIQKDSFYSVSNAITTLTVSAIDNIENNDGTIIPEKTEEKIRVYLFNSEEDLKSTETEKSLRIMTMYGIGYVGLVREGEPGASNFKICLGQTKTKNNIIRCLEKR